MSATLEIQFSLYTTHLNIVTFNKHIAVYNHLFQFFIGESINAILDVANVNKYIF